jgi:hypothetical protein
VPFFDPLEDFTCSAFRLRGRQRGDHHVGNIRSRVRGFPQVAVGGFDLFLKAMVLFDELGVRAFE